ncbi:TadG family pilus assembly protein [Novosphingobium resinovorum]|uniref:Membrane protein n=1 Tax=Novosphingobium resinovorum TaxID=158500 RepID=A0A031JRU7_9SPHN|nr:MULTISPECIES: TadG family pilus assembly protein [Novosphingobium]AOR79259.1 hypothetical protein BES08_20565 [Novosphingobium resinovorum]EZP79660.1 Membrane protein [Novosphingobium resinovorum]MBF7014109.1 hypothetical protein [Novosphingobium sp. HR1a]WJM26250.1 TadG family pilus assembly protein [Novosphingobium resinovorum]
MSRLRATIRRLRRDERGVVAPAVAVLGVPLLLSAGLALDVALYYSGNRELRIATEAAALAASMRPTDARSLAETYLQHNGYDPSVIRNVEIGYYCANDDRKAADNAGSRFFLPGALPADCAGSAVRPNAVRVTTGKGSRRFLTGVLGDMSPIPDLAATASAARIDEAGISATSGLLDVSTMGVGGLLHAVNGVLGGLLGVSLNLSASQIEALLGGNVDAGLFFDELAERSGFTGTYGDLIKGSYDLRDIVAAAAQAAGPGDTRNALNAFNSFVPGGHRVPLRGLFKVGVWRNMKVGEADVAPALRAGLNAYQLISYAVQDDPVAVDLSQVIAAVSPPPLLTGSQVVIAAAASGPVNRPRFSFGPAGETEVGTSMLRLKVQVTLLNLPLGVARANVPVIIDIQSADGSISSIDCAPGVDQQTNTTVRVVGHSSLVSAYIGDMPSWAMDKPLLPIKAADITKTEILHVGVPLPLLAQLVNVTLKGRAVAEPVLGGEVRGNTLVFGPGTIGGPTRSGTPQSVLNQARIGNTVQGLVNSLTGPGGLELDCPLLCALVQPVVNGSGLIPAVTQPVTGIVTAVVDPLLTNVLVALGIQLGHGTFWVGGVRCGVPVLI